MNAAHLTTVKISDSSRRILVRTLGVLSTFFIAVCLEARLRSFMAAESSESESVEQSINPRAAEMLSLGHLPALVDSLVIRGLNDPATAPVKPGTHPALFYLMDLATQLDPLQFELYWLSAALLSVVRRDGLGTETILDRAHQRISGSNFPSADFRERYWSYSWQLELMRGYNALFELRDFEKARESFALASTLPGGLPFFGPLSERLNSREGRIEVCLRALRSLIQRENDPLTQRRLEDNLKQAQLVAFLIALEKDYLSSRTRPFDRFLQQRQITSDPEGGTLSWNSTRRRIQTSSSLGDLGKLYW